MYGFLKKIAKELFFKIFNKKLSHSSKQEQHEMNEFKEQMQKIVNEFENAVLE